MRASVPRDVGVQIPLPAYSGTKLIYKAISITGMWKVKQLAKIQLKNPVLIEGLPGMGNVGKIAVDYLIDVLKARKVFEITSNDLPHCVFINDDNLVELPSIEIYHKIVKGRSILLLAGDIQPTSERSCYDFCNAILDTFQKGKGKEIITLGGIGLPKIPKKPKVFATANSKKILARYNNYNSLSDDIRSVVGPIVGVSGLLTGLAGKREIPSITLLAETFGHPSYLGIKGARTILEILNEHLGLKIDLSGLEEEAEEFEQEIKERKLSRENPGKSKISFTYKQDTIQQPDRRIDYFG